MSNCGNCQNNDDGRCTFWESFVNHLMSCRSGYVKKEEKK